ncbi:unnamed protein product [Symbiodinium microadriaticum]|nr:unnamed protein product [Symbiodinium microadriaticum]
MGRGKAKVQVPDCRYGAACTRRDCVFKHPPKPAKSVRQQAPIEKSDKVCFAFVAGKCAFGRQCHDKHPDEASCQSIKERYGKIDCQWGKGCRTDGCLYRHPSDEPVGPALRLEMKPQPAVYAPGYAKVPAFKVTSLTPELANDNDRNDLPVFRHLEDRDENSRDRPQRDRLQEWLEEQDAQELEELKASSSIAPASPVPLRAPLDEEEEEQERQEQLAATLRFMGFVEEPSLGPAAPAPPRRFEEDWDRPEGREFPRRNPAAPAGAAPGPSSSPQLAAPYHRPEPPETAPPGPPDHLHLTRAVEDLLRDQID